MIIGGSGTGKTNALPNLINKQNDINQIYLYAKDLSEPKYEILIKKHENAGIKYFNNPNAFIECSNSMDDVYENINDYNPFGKKEVLVVFHDMIVDIMTNNEFKAIIKELFIRCRKLNISILFFRSKRCKIKFNTICDYEDQQQKRINHSADIDYQDFMNIYRECTKEPFNFLTIDTTLPASNLLRFRKNLFDPL